MSPMAGDKFIKWECGKTNGWPDPPESWLLLVLPAPLDAERPSVKPNSDERKSRPAIGFRFWCGDGISLTGSAEPAAESLRSVFSKTERSLSGERLLAAKYPARA